MLGFDNLIDIDRIIDSLKHCNIKDNEEIKILKQFKIDFRGHSDHEIIKALNRRINRLDRIHKAWEPDKRSKGYRDGYLTGFKWKYDYIPGGPWHYGPGPYDNKEQKERALDSIDNYKNWHAGFKAGLKLNKRKCVQHLK